jgi:hypothetical protein
MCTSLPGIQPASIESRLLPRRRQRKGADRLLLRLTVFATDTPSPFLRPGPAWAAETSQSSASLAGGRTDEHDARTTGIEVRR